MKASLQIAKLLIENDCDPSVRNHRGQTVLTLAIQKVNKLAMLTHTYLIAEYILFAIALKINLLFKGNNELVKILLNDGCQVTAEVDDTGENLLHALVEHSWETDLASLVQIIKDSVRTYFFLQLPFLVYGQT